MGSVPLASAQTSYVTAVPGYINLGMTSTITVTAPGAGTYTVVVQSPSGASAQVNFTFTAAGQTQNATYGSATAGFNATVSKPGTYDVFLEQGGTVVSSTSFYATDKMVVARFDVVNGGVCAYIQDITRGSKMFPRFFVQYASNGAWVTNATLKVVTFNLPDNTLANATWHKAAAEGVGFFIGKVYPNWNSTWTGNYIPKATAQDIYGNTLNFTYTGRPIVILPTPLTITPQIVDAKTGQMVTGLYSGQNVNVTATVAYTAAGVSGTEILPGFLGPLDQSRGGAVTALVGWGYFNTTSHSFGSSKNPGGLIASLKLTYTGSKGLWSAPLAIGTLPTLPAGTTYVAIINASDNVATPNTGTATLNLSPATIQTSTFTTTSATTTTATSISTTTTTAVSTSLSTFVSTSLSTFVSTVTQTGQAEATTWTYVAMVVLLVVGLAIGYVMRRPAR